MIREFLISVIVIAYMYAMTVFLFLIFILCSLNNASKVVRYEVLNVILTIRVIIRGVCEFEKTGLNPYCVELKVLRRFVREWPTLNNLLY